jgi:hypothetical protein
MNWEEMQQNFVITFSFEDENPMVDTPLKVARDRIFEEPEFEIVRAYQNQNRHTNRNLLHYYHIAKEDPIEENQHDIQITKVKREREVEGPQLESEEFSTPLNRKKVNIGMEESLNV